MMEYHFNETTTSLPISKLKKTTVEPHLTPTIVTLSTHLYGHVIITDTTVWCCKITIHFLIKKNPSMWVQKVPKLIIHMKVQRWRKGGGLNLLWVGQF